jgi:hypothetical protein
MSSKLSRNLPVDDAAPTEWLTTAELARRWRRRGKKSIERNARRWGLTPVRFGGGPLLFHIKEIQQVEERALRGEIHAVLKEGPG